MNALELRKVACQKNLQCSPFLIGKHCQGTFETNIYLKFVRSLVGNIRARHSRESNLSSFSNIKLKMILKAGDRGIGLFKNQSREIG